MTDLNLTGLDAQNPLGFFAALGLLRVVAYQASRSALRQPRLSFLDEGRQVPVLHTELSKDEVFDLVLYDAAGQASSPALRLAYDGDGKLVEPETPHAKWDLKPVPAAARTFLERCASADRRAADLAGAFLSELVQDRTKGNTKPSALHFTAGQQGFLLMVDQIRQNIKAEDVHEALLGPWQGVSTLPSLAWDASVTRMYALRAGDPSKEKRGSVPAAYWLGVQALPFFPVQAKHGRLVTTRVVGGWKDSVFTWPVWDMPLTVPTIAALLRTAAERWTSPERRARGITAVLSSRILRSDQGGYGSFAPAEIVLPRQFQ